MNKRFMAMVLLAIVIMMPAAFAARPTADTTTQRAALSEEDAIEIPNEDEINAEPDSNTRIELCIETVKELRPSMSENKVRNLCRTRFMIKNVERLGQLKAEAQKIKAKVMAFKSIGNKEEFKNFKKVRNFKARIVAQSKLNKARIDFAKAKKDFLEAKEGFERAKLRLKGAKELKEKCQDPESEECAAAKEELREAAKEHFINQADIIIRNLEQIKSRAESSEAITEERASKIINWSDEKIAVFEAIKVELEAAQTKEEILDAAKKLRDEWSNTKLDVKAYVGHIVNARIGGIIVKSKFLEAKLERTLEKMEENGKDTSTVQPLVDDFNTKVEEARTAYEEALGHFDDAAGKKGDERAGHIREAQESMKEAKKALIEATKILRDIIKEVRSQGAAELEEASTEVDEETEEEEEEEEETEEEEPESEEEDEEAAA